MSLAERMKMFEVSSNAENAPGQPARPAVRRTWGTPTVSASDTIAKIAANDSSIQVVDLSSNAVFQIKVDEYCQQLSDALKNNTHVRDLTLVNCNIGDKACEFLSHALASNKSITNINLEKNNINQEGASALAMGLANNKGVLSINLMNQKNVRWGDKCLDDFLDMFHTNVTLLKINWRLESRKSFALNKMITRNNEIDRRRKCGMNVQDILPTGLKGADQGHPPPPPVGKENSIVTTVEHTEQPDSHHSDHSSEASNINVPPVVPTVSTFTKQVHNTSSSVGSNSSGVAIPPKRMVVNPVAGADGDNTPHHEPAFNRPRRSANSVLNRWPPGGQALESS